MRFFIVFLVQTAEGERNVINRTQAWMIHNFDSLRAEQ